MSILTAIDRGDGFFILKIPSSIVIERGGFDHLVNIAVDFFRPIFIDVSIGDLVHNIGMRMLIGSIHRKLTLTVNGNNHYLEIHFTEDGDFVYLTFVFGPLCCRHHIFNCMFCYFVQAFHFD